MIRPTCAPKCWWRGQHLPVHPIPGAVGEGIPGTQTRGGGRLCPYLSQGVDVDLAPLPALAEVHGGSHQQHVRDTVAVHVQGVDLASVVGADLGETGGDGSSAASTQGPRPSLARTAQAPSYPMLWSRGCRRSLTTGTLRC